MRRHGVALVIALVIPCLLALSACARDINDLIESEPCVKGMVTQIGEESITIQVSAQDPLYRSYTSLVLSLHVERADSMTHFKVGDEVAVYYNGEIQETYPAQIPKVYAILLIGNAG